MTDVADVAGLAHRGLMQNTDSARDPLPEIQVGYFLPGMPRKYERGASLVQAADRRVSAAEAQARLTERDEREAADTRTPAARWLGDPAPGRSALPTKKPRR